MIVRETIDADSVSPIVIDYMYDNNGRPYRIMVNTGNTVYSGYYVLNLQGDVVAIIDASGKVLVEYTYNAWGEQQACMTHEIEGSALYEYNRLKYRGYYFDEETGFYYLNSRFYDPVIGRFINADEVGVLSIDQSSLLQYNLYIYALNNPINETDYSGQFAISIGALIGCTVAGAIISTASYAFGCLLSGEEITTGNIVLSMVTGGICGAAGGIVGAASAGVQFATSLGVGIFSGYVTSITSGSSERGIIAGFTAGITCGIGTMMTFDGGIFNEALAAGLASCGISFFPEVWSQTLQQEYPTKGPELYIPPVDNITYPGRRLYEGYGLLYNFHSGYVRR